MKNLTVKERRKELKKLWAKHSITELIEILGVAETTISRDKKALGLPSKPPGSKRVSVKKISIKEIQELREKNDQKKADKKYIGSLLEENRKLTKEMEAVLAITQRSSPVMYKYKPLTVDTESIAVALASDWHIEENIISQTVNGLNSFNLAKAKERAEQFFRVTLRLIQIEQQATKIDTLVLALLGDFISGNIHEALLEICELSPIDAMIEAESMILGGINYLLKNSKLKLIIPCHVGNHSRITKKVHIATETGNSLETIMYSHIKNYFKGNARVEVLISPAYLSYLDVWGYTICFSHGHAVKYQGGIGGLTIPLRKAVNEWQENRRADLYCIGHWHQMLDIGEAIVNGSLCGYNSFAMFIKARYQRPMQTFFIINKKHRAKTVVRPILFNS